jgi:hypothetical protein
MNVYGARNRVFASQFVHKTAQFVWLLHGIKLCFSRLRANYLQQLAPIGVSRGSNLIHYSIMITWTSFWVIVLAGNREHHRAANIGSSNHFEVAIAVPLYGTD